MTLSEAINARRSIRKYESSAVVTDEQVKELLTAAMLAPSACNVRPWEFMVVRNRDRLTEITKVHPYTQMLRTASLAIITCVDTNLKTDISEGFFPQDCGAVTENMLLKAVELGLGACWCGVYPKENLIANIKKIFQMPENIIPINVIAVGKPAEQPEQRGFYEESKVKWIE